jgi:diaminopimelate decarboxylase
MTIKTTPLTLEKVKEIAKIYPTPFVIYDKKAIINNFKEFKEAFSWAPIFKNFFAVKACPNPTILKILKDL